MHEMQLWRVEFTAEFRSSSGMEAYTNSPVQYETFVLADGRDVDDVYDALKRIRSQQERVEILRAEWLGRVAVPENGGWWRTTAWQGETE